jgi:Cd2+/Zn2+-exporting ATPase/Cu+-exporting ATPase
VASQPERRLRSWAASAVLRASAPLSKVGSISRAWAGWILDKTGTLTFGRPEVQAVIAIEGVSSEAVLEAASAAEVRSEHPLGQAIVAYARAQGRSILEPERFDYTPGRGIAAVIGGATVLVGNRMLMADRGIAIPANLAAGVEAASEIFVARDGRLLGAIAVADTVRPEARRAVEALSRMRLRTILLTGDTKAVADAVNRRKRCWPPSASPTARPPAIANASWMGR